MKKNNSYFIFFLTLILIFSYSYLRSYIDGVVFIIAFDNVTTIILNKIWTLINEPTIFVALAVIFLLLVFRNNLLEKFPFLSEIKAGSFSAVFDSKNPTSSEEPVAPNQRKERVPKEREDKSVKYYEWLIENLPKNSTLVNSLLELDQKNLTIEEFVELLRKNSQGSYLPKNATEEIKYAYYQGVFRSLYGSLFQVLLYFNVSEDSKRALITLKPGVKELLIQKQIRDDKDTKNL